MTTNKQSESGRVHRRGDDGLIDAHAYCLIQLRKIRHEGREEYLVQLRNPWSKEEWLGDWSDTSSKWTEETKALTGFQPNSKDGLFWMSFADYQARFTHLQVCKYSDHGEFESLRLDCKTKRYHFVLVRFSEDGQQTLSLSQKDKKCFPRDALENFNFAACRMILLEQDSDRLDDLNELRYLKSMCSRGQRDTYLEVVSDRRKLYALYIEMEWNETTVLPGQKECVSLTCYGEGRTRFEGDVSRQYSQHEILSYAFLSKIHGESSDFYCTDLSEGNGP